MDDDRTSEHASDRPVAAITAADVLPLPTPHLDRARRAAQQAVAAAARRDRAARTALDRSEQELADARRGLDACDSRRQELLDELADAEAQHRAACDRLDAVRSDEQDAADEVGAAQRALAPLDRAEQAMAALLDAGAPRDPDGVPTVRAGLAEAARLVDALDPAPGTAALVTWSEQLASGTAPVRDDAAAMLVELEHLDAEWQACGEGDLDRDPVVVAAQARCDASEQAVAAVQAGGLGTAAGHQARTAIELAHQRRTQLEAAGRRADPDELAQAVRDEDAALAHVGFDSWLDFRLTMSGAGVGALVERRREVAADELAAARSALREAREQRSAHHDAVQRRREQLQRRAVEELALDASLPLAAQLRGVLALPVQVSALAEEVARRTDAAREQVTAAAARHRSAQHSLDEATTATHDTSERIDRCRRALERCERDLEVAESRVTDAGAVRSERRTLAEAAAHALAEATSQEDELARTEHLPEDLDDAIAALVRLAEERSVDGGTPRLIDPLATLPVAATLRLADALDAAGRPVELIITRRALRSALRHRTGVVTVVDGRRRRRPFGQRRRREPTVSTR